MDERIDELTHGHMDEKISRWTDVWIEECMYGWMDGCTDGWMDGWTDTLID